jgi:superfamily II DNA or RNA helicase
VRGDVKATAATRILFCTYGVLLRRMQDDPTLGSVQLLVLDEVHERGNPKIYPQNWSQFNSKCNPDFL